MIRLVGANAKKKIEVGPFNWPNVSGSGFGTRILTHSMGTPFYSVEIFRDAASGLRLVPMDRGVTGSARYGYYYSTGETSIQFILYRNIITGGGASDNYIAVLTEL